jgi:hypothetical protein
MERMNFRQVLECAGKAKRRRRFGMCGDIKYSIRALKSGVAASLATAVQNRVTFIASAN